MPEERKEEPEQGPRILCLDDREENLRFRKLFLEQFGCTVVTVLGAHECLQLAESQDFDLAILDYHLAGETTGEDVAHDLRAMRPGLLLMMLSGDPNIPESAKTCVDAVLLKGSSNPTELLDAVQSLLPDCKMKPHRKPVSRDSLLENMRKVHGPLF